ncbi:MAG: hypothetical protein WD271_15215 [Acidimicrobiia bacterium]
MIIGIVLGAVIALCIALVVAVARDKGPGPGDVAVSYEYAWDRLDFDVLWTLSAKELRDGLDRKQFVAAKRAAYEQQPTLRGLVAHVGVDDASVTTSGDAALVNTSVDLRDDTTVHNVVQLARRNSRWQVVAYRLAPTSST